MSNICLLSRNNEIWKCLNIGFVFPGAFKNIYFAILFYMYECVTCLCTMCILGAGGNGQKLHMIVKHHMRSGTLPQVLWEKTVHNNWGNSQRDISCIFKWIKIRFGRQIVVLMNMSNSGNYNSKSKKENME